jgi:hypothetical protein
VPYILDEFSYYFENAYDETDPNFPDCNIDRPSNSSPDGKMYIVNHMLHIEIDLPFPPLGPIQVPDGLRSFITNSKSSITKQANMCRSLYKRMPNVVLVSTTPFDLMNIYANGI